MTKFSIPAAYRRAILAGILFLIAAAALEALSPWYLPVRIIEGPMVQQPGETGASLIWYTTRSLPSGACEVVLAPDPRNPNEQRTFPAQADGTRERVRIDGLAPDQIYPYRIRYAGRTLAEGNLHTNRRAGEPFSFIVFGDSGRGTPVQYRLAEEMRRFAASQAAPPDFLLHTGDLIYGHGQRSGYKDRFFAPYRHWLADIPFWPALGNHDVESAHHGEPYLSVFELPEDGPPGLPAERNYWFDYASARIVVIDSNTDEDTLQAHVAPWLRDVFAASTATWKLVALHHPPYTGGHYKPNLFVQRALVPAFEAAGVDVVFCGHDHMYQRTYALRGGQLVPDGQGIVYVITAAGGAQLYKPLPADQRPAYIACLHDERHSFTYVAIDGLRLSLRQIDVDGQQIDEWSLTKHPPASGPATQSRSAPATQVP